MKTFSPSSAHRWVPCPGSVKLSQPFLEDIKQTEAAAEGELAHWVAEQVAKGCPPSKIDREGVTEEMLDGATVYAAILPDDASLEEWASCELIHPAMTRTRVDAVFRNEETKTLSLVDYKFGHTNVEAFENLQLLSSVVGFNYKDYEFIELIIVQPRAFGEPPVKSWKLTSEKFEEHWLPLLREAAEQVVMEEPPTQTGNHCIFCPARHACKSLSDQTRAFAEYSNGAVNLELTPRAAGVELALLLDAAERIKHRISGIEAQVEGWLKEGKPVLGFQLSQSYSNLRWSASDEKVLQIAKLQGVSVLSPPKLLTPTQAKKAGLSGSVVEKLSRREYLGDKVKRVNQTEMRKVYEQ